MVVTSDHFVVAIPLDFPLFVDHELLGLSLSMMIDGRVSSLRFPEMPATSDGQRGNLECPAGTPRALNGHVEHWGELFGQLTAEVKAVVMAVEAHGKIDWDIESHPAGGDDLRAISDNIHAWFDSFIRWVFCLTAQSLDVGNPDPKMIHRESSNMVQVVTVGERSTRPQIASLFQSINVDFTGGPSSERVLTAAIAKVAAQRAGTSPPAVLELLASARLFRRRADLRRALVDAGTAAEGAIVRMLGSTVAGQTLGQLVNICPSVQIDAKVNLVEPRNDAVHRGMAPSYAIADRAIEIVEDLVLQVESDLVAAASLRHVSRPQRVNLVFIRPTDKSVELAEKPEGPDPGVE